MKTKIDVTLKPLAVPNFVLLDGDSVAASDLGTSVPISSLDPLTLDSLCRQFREDLFKKAGKQQPAMAAPRCAECGVPL